MKLSDERWEGEFLEWADRQWNKEQARRWFAAEFGAPEPPKKKKDTDAEG